MLAVAFLSRRFLVLLTTLFLTALSLSACSNAGLAGADQSGTQPTTQATDQSADQGQAQILEAQNWKAKKVEVTVTARVFRLLPSDRKGNPHQRFLLRLDNGTTVLVAHNTRVAPAVPLAEGDMVRIHGEYIWNEKGGVLHWTHRAFNDRHESGWIEYKGQLYQ